MERLLAAPPQPSGPSPSFGPERIRDYQLVRLLGRGGMGCVYLARHMRLHRDVALKVLREELADDPVYRARFEREMAVVGPLDHPHLIRAQDAGAEGPHLFLVMELLDGRDLGAVVRERGALPVADACEAARQAALGLHHAHEHGLVHRDVKASNLFLTRAGVVKVIDLGLARPTEKAVAGDLSSAMLLAGTPECMSPEQWEGADVDRRADVYALGCTLIVLLTGRPPFALPGKPSWLAWMDAHGRVVPPSLGVLRPDAPADLATLVAQMLAKAPGGRPASAAAVAEALAPFTAGHHLGQVVGDDTPLTRPRSAPLGARARSRGRRAAAVGLGIVGLALALWFFRVWPFSESVRTDPVPTSSPAPAGPLVLRPYRTLTGHTDWVLAVAFSPDGKTLASAAKDRTILLWDTHTWKSGGPLAGHQGQVIDLAFAPDGTRLASVSSQPDVCALRLWDPVTGLTAGTLGGPSPGMFAVAYTPDGRTLACGGFNRAVLLFDTATGKERLVIPEVCPGFLRGFSISDDGRQIATGGTGPTRLWDVATGKEVPTARKLPEGMVPLFLPRGMGLSGWTYSEGRVSLCDLPSGEVRAAWKAQKKLGGLPHTRDGRFLASVGDDSEVRIWATDDQQEVATLVGHRGRVYGAAFSPDGRFLATTGVDDLTVRIWELPPRLHSKR
jgi:serine/threonine protein kinase